MFGYNKKNEMCCVHVHDVLQSLYSDSGVVFSIFVCWIGQNQIRRQYRWMAGSYRRTAWKHLEFIQQMHMPL